MNSKQTYFKSQQINNFEPKGKGFEHVFAELKRLSSRRSNGHVRLHDEVMLEFQDDPLWKLTLEAGHSSNDMSHQGEAKHRFYIEEPVEGSIIRMDAYGLSLLHTALQESSVESLKAVESAMYYSGQILSCLLHTLDLFAKTKVNKYKRRASVRQSLIYWMLQVLSEGWVKEIKYHLNYLFVHSERMTTELDIEYPERGVGMILGEDGRVFYGRLQRELTIKLNTKAWKPIRKAFRWTLLNGVKRGMPTVSAGFILNSLKSHSSVLSTEKPTGPHGSFDGEEVELSPYGQYATIVRYWAKRLVRRNPNILDFGDIGYKVSSNACCELPKSRGGALGLLHLRFSDSYKNNCSAVLSSPTLYRMDYHPRLGVWADYYRFDIGAMAQAAHLVSQEPDFEKPPVSVQFIQEPLKCRTITKDSLFTNGIYKNIQSYLWSELRRYPQFKLIGETISPETIVELANATTRNHFWRERGVKQLPGCDRWVSGDYSAATDKLHLDITLAAAEGVSHGDPVLFSILKRALKAEYISYVEAKEQLQMLGASEIPLNFGMVPDLVKQENGQLMGCMFSFPLLCIANFATYALAFDKTRGSPERFDPIYWSNYPVLVNGDDILFRANEVLERNWEEAAEAIGFEKSLGKNFRSDKFCTVNSCYFEINLLTENNIKSYGTKCHYWSFPNNLYSVRSVPYLNLGFVHDCAKGSNECLLTPVRGLKAELFESRKSEHFMKLNFGDYVGYWVGSPLEEYMGKATGILLRSRKDIGWSRRARFDLGLTSIDSMNPRERCLSEDLAGARGGSRFGLYPAVRSSNQRLTWWCDNFHEPYHCYLKQAEARSRASLVTRIKRQLLADAKSVIENAKVQSHSKIPLNVLTIAMAVAVC